MNRSATIIALAIEKGGSGKTTITSNVGYALAQNGYDVLLVDLDPQASLTLNFFDNSEMDGIIELLDRENDTPAQSLTRNITILDPDGTLDILTSDIYLAQTQVNMTNAYKREEMLSEALAPLRSMYDFILIDCPPSIGHLMINALNAADQLVIPCCPETNDMRSAKMFLSHTVQTVKQRLNPNLRIRGVVLNQYRKRFTHHRDTAHQIAQFCPLMDSTIGQTVKLAEASRNRLPLATYAPNNPQVENFDLLAKEIAHG